jgi:general secretion pathway protein D
MRLSVYRYGAITRSRGGAPLSAFCAPVRPRFGSARLKYAFALAAVFFLAFSVFLSNPAMAAAKAAAAKPEKITINFVDVELSSIVRIMSELTGKNFIYDDSLKGKVTIVAPEKLTIEEAMSLFISSLELKNFSLAPSGDSFKIVPSSMVKQTGTRVLKESQKARADEYIVRLIPLDHISAQEAFAAVQPLISRFGQISIFGARNALLVVDTGQNVEKILKILGSVDALPSKGEPEIVYIKNARAEVIAQLLRKEEQRRSGRRAQDPGTASADAAITPDVRLNAVILSESLPDKDFYKRFIALLDVAPPEASSRINVYYLENAVAEDLGKVLDTLTKPAPAAGAQQAQDLQSLAQEFSGRIVITPDNTTNSLIVMASPSDYNNLVQVIRKLDRRPRQVFVEAMITEVTVDKAIELGTKFRITGKQGGQPVAIGGVGTIDTSAMQTILSGLAGLSIGGLSNFITVPVTRADGTTFNLTAPGFAALFSLSDFKDVVNVLSTPHILTSDNSDAEIMVGENVPFLSKLERDSTATAQPLLQSIERKDVGIRLKIKPKISEGDFVKLDIYQEISAVAPTTTAGASDLITTKRSAKTTVVVMNKQTVVIGGLIQDKSTNDTTKVPLLGDIPFLGWLFKSSKDQNQKTNLLVFITPYIIEDLHGLDELKKRKEQEFEEKSRPTAPAGKTDE